MPVARLLRLVYQNGQLFLAVHWKGFSTSEDTLERLHRVYEVVQKLVRKLLDRKSIPAALRTIVHAELSL